MGGASPSRGRWVPAWEAGEAARLPPSSDEGEVTGLPAIWEAWEAWLPAQDATKLLPSLGGRWVPGWEVTSWEAWLPAWDKLLPSPRGRWVPACAAKLLPSPGGRWPPGWEVTTWKAWEASLPAWDKLPPSPRGGWAPACLPDWVACATKLLPSLGGRRVPACLPAWEDKFGEFKELALVIFPSFLFSKLLNLFNCLCLTLVNLISPTLSTKPWHSLSLCAEIIDANCDLHNSVCLAMLSTILFIVFILPWSRSFSAFLIIFLAFSVFKIDLSLMLTGISSLWRHLMVKILQFL